MSATTCADCGHAERSHEVGPVTGDHDGPCNVRGCRCHLYASIETVDDEELDLLRDEP